MNLDGLRIAITGAFGGLGSQVVESVMSSGARVIAIDYAPADPARDRDNLLQLGGVDLTSEDSARQAFQTAGTHFGGLDALVNIAGGFVWETFADGSLASWDKMYNINVKTAVISCSAALPFLSKEKSSSIVNISALGSVQAGLGMAPYAASKAGVSKLTESLAEEFKGKGLRVNAVMPSIIDTAINRKDMPDADFSTWVSPAELANVISFLVSPQASAITGAVIPVVGRV